MIYAETKRFEFEDGSGYDKWYFVYNGDIIGSYRVTYRADGTMQDIASRDYHRIATQDEIAAYDAWRTYQAESDEVQEQMDKDGTAPDYAWYVSECCWHDNSPQCVCDGSYMVEVTDNEQRAFEIAAMMAEVYYGD